MDNNKKSLLDEKVSNMYKILELNFKNKFFIGFEDNFIIIFYIFDKKIEVV